MKRKIIVVTSLLVFSIATIAADSPYARRIRPMVGHAGACVENEIGYDVSDDNVYICKNTSWVVLGGSPDAVIGPASSTNNALAVFDGVTGKLLKNSNILFSTNVLSTTSGVISLNNSVRQLDFNNHNFFPSQDNVVDLGLAGIFHFKRGYFGTSLNSPMYHGFNTVDMTVNYERGNLQWAGNNWELSTDKGGTGLDRNIYIRSANDIYFGTDNAVTFSIQANGLFGEVGTLATIPTITGSTTVISPLFRSTTKKVLLQGTGTGATNLATTQTTPPTCSSNCGTSPSVAGTNTAMTVTMGSSGSPASGWVITFNDSGWAAAPTCTVQMGKTGMVVGKMPLTVVTTATTITVVTNGTAPATTDVYHIQCIGIQ